MRLGGFIGAVPIPGVWGVFSEFQFQFRVSVGGAGGFPLCAKSVGSQGVSRLGHVSFNFFRLL